MNTPSLSDFPDEHDRLDEWQRRRAGDEERERVFEALQKEPKERNYQDWLYINISPYGKGQGCGC